MSLFYRKSHSRKGLGSRAGTTLAPFPTPFPTISSCHFDYPEQEVRPAICGSGLIVSIDPRRLGVFADWARANGSEIEWSRSLDCAGHFAWVIVDIDSMGGIIECIVPLMKLRSEQPEIKVIAVSQKFFRDDFGTDRLPVADVCLKLPVSFDRIEEAAKQMQVNNRVWLGRIRADDCLS